MADNLTDASTDGGRSRLTERLDLIRLWAWLMVGVAAVVLFGIVDLLTLPGWVDQRYVWALPLEASWGSLLTFVVAGAYASIARHPSGPWPGLVLLAAATLALLLCAVFGADARPLGLVAAVGIPAAGLALLAWQYAQPLPLEGRLSWPHLLLGLAGIPLWLLYALHAFDMSRRDPNPGHTSWGIEHWPVQGATGLTMLAAALIMVWWIPGRPLMRVAISLSAVYIGVAMLAYPDRAGAMDGPMWGVAMVFWGTMMALLPARPSTRPVIKPAT